MLFLMRLRLAFSRSRSLDRHALQCALSCLVMNDRWHSEHVTRFCGLGIFPHNCRSH